MTAIAPTDDRRPPAARQRAAARGLAALALATALAAALAAACTARQVEDALYAGGKIAYDSMKARQHGE